MRRILLALALVVPPFACHAQAPAVLGQCIVEHLGAKDRGDLARWVFVSMAAHPDVKDFSNVGAGAAEDASRAVGLLVTRLMIDSCASEVQQAARGSTVPVVPATIQFLTQIGVQELMANRDVLGTLSNFSRFADRERIDRALQQR